MGRRPGREAADAGEACVFRRSRNGLRPPKPAKNKIIRPAVLHFARKNRLL